MLEFEILSQKCIISNIDVERCYKIHYFDNNKLDCNKFLSTLKRSFEQLFIGNKHEFYRKPLHNHRLLFLFHITKII